MRVKDLDGKEYEWQARGRTFLFGDMGSSLHKKARLILHGRFPTVTILEEVSIPVRKRKTLYFDFYLPGRKLAIEVHGEQHYSFSSLFHKTKADFVKQKKNDREKAEWCEINGIQLVELSCREQDMWEDIL